MYVKYSLLFCVSNKINHLLCRWWETSLDVIFSRLFPVILTDNESEFSNPKEIERRGTVPCNRTNVFYCDPSEFSDPQSIEFGPDRKSRSRIYIFYCDPSSPHQKGACEVNHELIRRIVPKGKSFDDFTQDDIFLMMDHIN